VIKQGGWDGMGWKRRTQERWEIHTEF